MDIDETTPLSRRRFLASAGALGAAAWLAPERLAAQKAGIVETIRRAAATEPIGIHRLRDNFAVLSGNGGNVAALAGPDGVLLVDSGIVGPRVAAAVRGMSGAPIRHVINTHWHFDHTDANAWMHRRGAALIAHEKTRARMSAETRVEDWNFTFPASARTALPGTTFAAEHSLQLNGSAIALKHYGPAHTDTDVSAHFTGLDVLHVGDTWWNGLYPFMDYSTGGSIGGMIAATEQNLAMAGASTLVVPGHGPVGGRADLARYRDMLVAVRDRVARLKAEGRTEAEVIAAKPTAPFDAAWGGAIISPAVFTHLVYQGV